MTGDSLTLFCHQVFTCISIITSIIIFNNFIESTKKYPLICENHCFHSLILGTPISNATYNGNLELNLAISALTCLMQY